MCFLHVQGWGDERIEACLHWQRHPSQMPGTEEETRSWTKWKRTASGTRVSALIFHRRKGLCFNEKGNRSRVQIHRHSYRYRQGYRFRGERESHMMPSVKWLGLHSPCVLCIPISLLAPVILFLYSILPYYTFLQTALNPFMTAEYRFLKNLMCNRNLLVNYYLTCKEKIKSCRILFVHL